MRGCVDAASLRVCAVRVGSESAGPPQRHHPTPVLDSWTPGENSRRQRRSAVPHCLLQHPASTAANRRRTAQRRIFVQTADSTFGQSLVVSSRISRIRGENYLPKVPTVAPAAAQCAACSAFRGVRIRGNWRHPLGFPRGLLSVMLVVENHVCRSVGLDVSLRQALRSAAPYLQRCSGALMCALIPCLMRV